MKFQTMGLELVRATEAAALSAGRWMGFGKRDEPDNDAIEAMHQALNQLEMDGHIVVGEEEKLHRHSLLDTGRKVGTGQGPELDIVVDPIDGRNLLARGHPDAIAVAGAAPRGTMWSPPADALYMEKLVVNREAANVLVPECLDAPAAWTLALVARAKKKEVRDLVVFVLDRTRHTHLIEEIRAVGARVLLRPEGDIAGALMAASPGGKVDLLMGIGGIPEGVIANCAVKALGGAMLGRVAPQSDEEREAVKKAGLDTSRILNCDQLVHADNIFFAATGITDGVLLSGV
ncbi:class II fructose-bisphosphatase, partial [Acidobacteria bacterium AH-259-D05]|nr:class II fructose-bisphosphatase [Acidobacteria bacterium AH-259-D05]